MQERTNTLFQNRYCGINMFVQPVVLFQDPFWAMQKGEQHRQQYEVRYCSGKQSK